MKISDADRYQAHKDDVEEWGDAPKTATKPSRRLAAMVSVRLTPDEEARVRAAATSRGQSLSDFVRSAALTACAAPESTPLPLLSMAITTGYLSAPSTGELTSKASLALVHQSRVVTGSGIA